MAIDNPLTSRYFQRDVVRQRNQITLIQWAAYVAAEAIPSPADDNWVRLRIVAENMPMSLDQTTQQTLGYFLQDPATIQNITSFISEDNDTPTEQNLSATNQSICGTFMPRYALATVTQQQIDTWRQNNNSPASA